MKNMDKQRLFKIIKIVFLLLVAVFLFIYFKKNIVDIKNMNFKINWKIFILSMFFYFVYIITLASLWHYITKLDKVAIKYSKAMIAYLYSILGKYIPGKVFMLGARVPAYLEAGVKIRKVTICFLLENACTLLGAAFLFIISLFFFPNRILENYKFITIALIIIFFICINPKVINFFLGKLEKVMKKVDLLITITYSQMIKLVALFIGNWLILGAGFYILTCSIYPLPLSHLLYVGGVFALSIIIGILSIFTPSGIGVREGIIVLGLSIVMPSEYAVIISIVSRLWATIAELILIFLAFIVSKIQTKFYRKCEEIQKSPST